MLSIMAIGCLTALIRPSFRPFVFGFTAFGSVAVLIFAAWGYLSPASLVQTLSIVMRYVVENTRKVQQVIPRDWLASLIATSWQSLFAIVGGLLSRRFEIVIRRRQSVAIQAVS
jgi:hypothetical protein